MKLTFLGAAHEVTGSRYLLEACDKRILVDYGMEQGVDYYENAPLPVAAGMIDYVFVTHAHIDHSGWLPLLTKQGFKGQIFATEATTDLCSIMLQDSAHIQESDAEWKNRKALRSGREQVQPLYTTEDAQNTMALFVPCKYRQQIKVCDGVSIRFVDVGHLLGSASILVEITEGDKPTRIAFSGDIGNVQQPLLRDPQYITDADFVVMESTYGDRSHGERADYIAELTKVLQATLDRGGNVVIPSFAVGRTQELLYFIRQIKQERLVKGHDGFPVYMDSPLAIEATNVFKENTQECADEETLALLRAGVNPISFDGLKLAVSADESKLINDDPTPKVIISASGMCDAGRIRHHLKHNLWREECTILFAGYQSIGTLGRSLVDGATEVKLFGETVQVAAHVERLSGVSGHADNKGLMKWIGSFTSPIKHVFVTHGDDEVTELFAARLRDELHLNATAPYNGERWDLATETMLAEGNKTRIEKPTESKPAQQTGGKRDEPKLMPRGAKQKPADGGTYGELIAAMQRLGELIERMRDSSRKEQAKLTNQLYVLVKKFSRKL